MNATTLILSMFTEAEEFGRGTKRRFSSMESPGAGIVKVVPFASESIFRHTLKNTDSPLVPGGEAYATVFSVRATLSLTSPKVVISSGSRIIFMVTSTTSFENLSGVITMLNGANSALPEAHGVIKCCFISTYITSIYFYPRNGINTIISCS